jgi:hypothetical protein
MEKQQNGLSFGTLLSVLITGFVCIIIIIFALNYFKVISLQKILYPESPTLQDNFSKKQNAENSLRKIVAKAGEENIYQKDLDIELLYYPMQKNAAAQKLLLEKIAKDSIILQSAQNEGLVKLDESVFNSPQKDYLKRMKLVADVRKAIENKQDSISGNVISLWFFNTKVAAVGYDKGKEIALSKITDLYNGVKSKKITPQQAAQEIINDSSLAQIDTSYDSNAILTFKAGPKDAITFDPAFDALIRQLAPGQVTDIYLAKDKDTKTGKEIDAVYMFAQVDARSVTGDTIDFDQWYAQRENNYEIVYY